MLDLHGSCSSQGRLPSKLITNEMHKEEARLDAGPSSLCVTGYWSLRIQMLRKLMGSLLSPWAWSLMGAVS